MTNPHRTTNRQLHLYVPTWLDEAAYYELAAALRGSSASQLIISFAQVTDEGTVIPPAVIPALSQMVAAIAKDGGISMAVGGYDPAQLKGWSAALARPDIFASSVAHAADQLSHQLNQPVNGLDIDMEFPVAAQATDMTRLIHTLRDNMPDAILTMAVPAEGLFIPVRPLVQYIDAFNIMTYDKDGPWSDRAGDLAPPSWTINCIKKWVAEIGDPAKVVVGFPAYGYVYPGCKKLGDRVDSESVRTILLSEILSRALPENPTADSSEGLIGGAWTSYVSPYQMRRTWKEIVSIFPQIGGSMVWSAAGVNAAVLQSLSQSD